MSYMSRPIILFSIQQFGNTSILVTFRCPMGLRCVNSDWTPITPGSVWNQTGELLRLTACPAGYLLVRSDSDPTSDHCQACTDGFYSLGIKSHQAYGNDSNAEHQCIPCPGNGQTATCRGPIGVFAKKGFWQGKPQKCWVENGKIDESRCLSPERRQNIESSFNESQYVMVAKIFRCHPPEVNRRAHTCRVLCLTHLQDTRKTVPDNDYRSPRSHLPFLFSRESDRCVWPQIHRDQEKKRA